MVSTSWKSSYRRLALGDPAGCQPALRRSSILRHRGVPKRNTPCPPANSRDRSPARSSFRLLSSSPSLARNWLVTQQSGTPRVKRPAMFMDVLGSPAWLESSNGQFRCDQIKCCATPPMPPSLRSFEDSMEPGAGNGRWGIAMPLRIEWVGVGLRRASLVSSTDGNPPGPNEPTRTLVSRTVLVLPLLLFVSLPCALSAHARITTSLGPHHGSRFFSSADGRSAVSPTGSREEPRIASATPQDPIRRYVGCGSAVR